MKKSIVTFCLVMAIMLLIGCTSQALTATNPTTTILYVSEIVAASENITGFLEKLELNGFAFEETGETNIADCFLSVGSRHFDIGSGQLTIYEFSLSEEMEKASTFICRSGFSIERPDPNQEGSMITFLISWANDPYWFKKDSLIVLYVGEDKRVINFLMENLVFFAGHSYPDNLSDFQTPLMRGFFGRSGTVVDIKPLEYDIISVLINYVYEHLTISSGDGYYVTEPGTVVQVEYFIDRNTLLLMDSELEIGMEITLFEFLAEPGEAPTKRMAFLVIDNEYGWIHVGRFDENFMSRCGGFSLAILDNAEIMFQDGTAFAGEHAELANRLLAVYVAMSASPPPNAPLIHGIGASRIIILNEMGLSTLLSGRIDIQNLLGLSYDELLELFGEPIEEIDTMELRVYFDNGLIVDVGAGIIVDFARVSNHINFHFNGIDGTSSYGDVINQFGQPDFIRESASEVRFNAVKSYAYEIQEANESDWPPFVRFYFDIDDNIVAIQFFIPA